MALPLPPRYVYRENKSVQKAVDKAAPNGEPVWEWSGFQQEAYRVHTFCKGEDSVNKVIIRTDV